MLTIDRTILDYLNEVLCSLTSNPTSRGADKPGTIFLLVLNAFWFIQLVWTVATLHNSFGFWHCRTISMDSIVGSTLWIIVHVPRKLIYRLPRQYVPFPLHPPIRNSAWGRLCYNAVRTILDYIITIVVTNTVINLVNLLFSLLESRGSDTSRNWSIGPRNQDSTLAPKIISCASADSRRWLLWRQHNFEFCPIEEQHVKYGGSANAEEWSRNYIWWWFKCRTTDGLHLETFWNDKRGTRRGHCGKWTFVENWSWCLFLVLYVVNEASSAISVYRFQNESLLLW